MLHFFGNFARAIFVLIIIEADRSLFIVLSDLNLHFELVGFLSGEACIRFRL
jgi:hypothetical protein